MADARDSSEIEQWIIINQMGAKPWTSDWQARKDFPFFLNPPFSSRYDGALLHCRRAIRNGWWGNERGVRGGGRGREEATTGEDGAKTGRSRKEKGFFGVWRIAERRQAMRTIWLLCQATCIYRCSFCELRFIREETSACARAKRTSYACDVCVLPINRFEFQGVNPLFRCGFHVGF